MTGTNLPLPTVIIYTDGACKGNPGPGGYAAILLAGGKRKEISGGYRRTTNNRMELMAVIAGLSALKKKCQVVLYTDSQYVAKGITLGWAKGWRARGWRKGDKSPVVNPDLWAKLLELLDQHHVTIEWVKGHAGNEENEVADRLSVAQAMRQDLPADPGFER